MSEAAVVPPTSSAAAASVPALPEGSSPELAAMVAHYPDHDYRDLNRFLIYKKKLKPALETYAKYCTWRETNLPIDPASCQTELDRGLMVPHGVDVEGRKVLWFLAAKQAKGVWDLDEVIRAFVHQFEQLLAEKNDPEEEFVLVLNRQGMDPKNFDIKFWRKIVPVLNDCYPERLGLILIYPTGFVFQGLWSMVNVLFSERARKKVKMLSKKPDLDKFIDPSQAKYPGSE